MASVTERRKLCHTPSKWMDYLTFKKNSCLASGFSEIWRNQLSTRFSGFRTPSLNGRPFTSAIATITKKTSKPPRTHDLSPRPLDGTWKHGKHRNMATSFFWAIIASTLKKSPQPPRCHLAAGKFDTVDTLVCEEKMILNLRSQKKNEDEGRWSLLDMSNFQTTEFGGPNYWVWRRLCWPAPTPIIIPSWKKSFKPWDFTQIWTAQKL